MSRNDIMIDSSGYYTIEYPCGHVDQIKQADHVITPRKRLPLIAGQVIEACPVCLGFALVIRVDIQLPLC